MSTKSILISLVLASYFIPNSVNAHTEHDKARFVATNGVDKGNCNNPVRPCQSISYAVSQASKGDKVLVAGGQYEITSESELFYLKSEIVPVIGGFNRFDHFQVQSPDTNTTTIVGAPVELRGPLQKAGFKVIADGKSATISNQLKEKLARFEALSQSQNNEACVDGRAGAFSCRNVDLVSHVPLPAGQSGNDIWGHVDLNTGIEYAIMGFTDGTRVYSLEDPSSPQLVGHQSGIRTSWRDFKVLQYFDETLNAYQAYAYVSSEASNGIQIIDLNNLPQSISLAHSDRTFDSAHNVYISNVDYSLNMAINGMQPRLQVVGADGFGGAFTSFDLTNPTAPVKSYDINSTLASNYTHDGSSMVVDDIRATRDCVNSLNGKCDVFIDFNEKQIRLWDNTVPAETTELGSVGYDDVALSNQYVHSGWWHDDKRHIYVHDEFDESRGNLNTTVRIIDAQDLTNPVIVGKWVSNNRTIDHNGFVKGNRYYMSNYERGLTILDISDPVNPVEIGYFDTFPSSNNASFNGAWGTYPYLPSGNILISDINSGLYVVKDTSRDGLPQVSFNTTELLVERGEQVSLMVNKPTALNEVASVSFDIIDGSGAVDRDVEVVNANNTLEWSANDNEAKAIELNIVDTAENTPKSFFLRLHTASANLQLSDTPVAQVNINGLASQGKVGFVQNTMTVSESANEVVVNLQRVGGSRGQISFDYAANFDTATDEDVEITAGTVTWADGDTANKAISFNVIDDAAIEGSEAFTLELTNGDTSLLSEGVLTVTISDNDTNQAPEVYAGNDLEMATSATITLSAATVTDPEDDALTYQWEHTSGIALTLADTDKLELQVTAGSQAGSAVLTLTATDIHGATSSDSLTVTVVSPAPVIPSTPQSGGSGGGSVPLWLLGALSLLVLRRKY